MNDYYIDDDNDDDDEWSIYNSLEIIHSVYYYFSTRDSKAVVIFSNCTFSYSDYVCTVYV